MSESSETQNVPIPQSLLDVHDIENAVKIIDFAADQGAFRGWPTISNVIIVRNRLVNFLLQANPQTEQQIINGE